MSNSVKAAKCFGSWLHGAQRVIYSRVKVSARAGYVNSRLEAMWWAVRFWSKECTITVINGDLYPVELIPATCSSDKLYN